MYFVFLGASLHTGRPAGASGAVTDKLAWFSGSGSKAVGLSH